MFKLTAPLSPELTKQVIPLAIHAWNAESYCVPSPIPQLILRTLGLFVVSLAAASMQLLILVVPLLGAI